MNSSHKIIQCLNLYRNSNILQVVDKYVVVQDSEGREVESQLLPIANASLYLRSKYVKAYLGVSPTVTPKYWLAFRVSVPPLGFNTYFVSRAKQAGEVSIFAFVI